MTLSRRKGLRGELEGAAPAGKPMGAWSRSNAKKARAVAKAEPTESRGVRRAPLGVAKVAVLPGRRTVRQGTFTGEHEVTRA